MGPEATRPWVVALVGSAGALAAVGRVLQALPAELPAAVVVLVHQAPDRVSMLAELLDRHSQMPVSTADDGGRLSAGEVVVIPSGRHMLITPARTTALIVSGAFPPSRPSADLLLATLATACGPSAVAVVLSGNGHDGATGATAVHDLGGTVVTSDEGSSEVFAMPAASIARDHAVDEVLAVEAIGPWLAQRLREPPPAAP